MKRVTIHTTILALTALLFTGCGDEIETKNMEQIYAEEGVPVRIETIQPGNFSSSIEHQAVLTGIKESSAFATIDDKIDRINYKVGDYVEKDAVVLSFPTDNPSAQYYQAKVNYENAQTAFERMKNYFDVGGLSRQDFDNAQASYEVAKANWDAVRQSVLVRAPISGIVTRINVRETENAHKDDELFAISQIDRLKARIWVSDKQICSISKGQNAVARWNGVTLRGEVVQVDMSMNQQRQAFGVVIEFTNPEMAMRCGVTATIDIETYQDSTAIAIERKNVIKEDTEYYVYVHNGSAAHKRPVTLGRSSETKIEILSGLNPGDELITEGQMHLDDGTKVRIIDSKTGMASE